MGAGPHLEQGRAAGGGGGGAGGRAGRRWRLLPQPWAGGDGGGEVALKGAGATGVRTSAWEGLSRSLRWGMGKRVASPRGQNQEGSQMEEENRSQEETETYVAKWGMVVGPNRSTWESSACAPEPPKTPSQRRLRRQWEPQEFQGDQVKKEQELKAEYTGDHAQRPTR